MMFSNLENYKIILASGSPRRYDLLKMSGLDFTVGDNRQILEEIPTGLEVDEVALELACRKARAWEDIWQEPNQMVITADTTVLLDDGLLGKPKNSDEAIEMLELLSGREHLVVTGVMICARNFQRGFSEETRVFFNPLKRTEIEYYVHNYKPLDKAGAYGIQEWIGLTGIRRIEGCYFNVMGLPVSRLMKELEAF